MEINGADADRRMDPDNTDASSICNSSSLSIHSRSMAFIASVSVIVNWYLKAICPLSHGVPLWSRQALLSLPAFRLHNFPCCVNPLQMGIVVEMDGESLDVGSKLNSECSPNIQRGTKSLAVIEVNGGFHGLKRTMIGQ